MKKTIIITALVVFVFITLPVRADLVELDLLALGLPIDFASSPWSYDFDLGVEFSSIDHVYMDWSGEITGGLARHIGEIEPFPFALAIKATLGGEYPDYRYAEHWGGGLTYPDPDPFDELTEFSEGTMPWSNIYDGKERILVNRSGLIMPGDVIYIEFGNITLDKANLVIDGTVIPEPSMFVMLILGFLPIKRIKNSHRIKV